MDNQTIKTRKIEIYSKENKTKVYELFRKISNDLCTAGNKVIRLHVNNQFSINDISQHQKITKTDAQKIFEETLGTSVRNSGYQSLSELVYIPSNIRTSFNSIIFKTIKSNFYDIVNNKVSVPSFVKTSMTIPFQFDKDKPFVINDNVYSFKFPTTKLIREEIGEINLSLSFGKDRSGNRVIVDRILSGEYELCDSSIKIKDNDFYLLLSFKFDSEKIGLDENKIMGIDMGINRAVSYYLTDTEKQPPQLDSLAKNIQHERIKLSKERSAIQASLKYGHGGHGRKRKLQTLDKLKEKERNWYKNKNHQISKVILDLALKNHMGTIKMEDLTGISKNKNEYFFKTWSYYQLQQFIEYKAKENGIKVLWVDPKYTSTTCPVCGNVDKKNRDKSIFSCTNNKCVDFNIEKDADIVAAINISKLEGSPTKGKKAKLETLKKSKINNELYETA